MFSASAKLQMIPCACEILAGSRAHRIQHDSEMEANVDHRRLLAADAFIYIVRKNEKHLGHNYGPGQRAGLTRSSEGDPHP